MAFKKPLPPSRSERTRVTKHLEKGQDSMGHSSIICPGDVQRMRAGSGVLHREYNPSVEEPVHFLQIWLQPNRLGATAGCAQKPFPDHERRGDLRLLVSPDVRLTDEGAVQVHGLADAEVLLFDLP